MYCDSLSSSAHRSLVPPMMFGFIVSWPSRPLYVAQAPRTGMCVPSLEVHEVVAAAAAAAAAGMTSPIASTKHAWGCNASHGTHAEGPQPRHHPEA